MGQEISDSEFDQQAFSEFRRRVDDETELLAFQASIDSIRADL